MNKPNVILLFLFVFSSCSIFSQVNDAGLWATISIEKKFTQSWSLEYAHCSRFNENISELGSIINELGVNYRLNKKSQFSLFYRSNFQRQQNNMYVPVSRFYLDYSYKIKPGDFILTMRLRFQHQQKNSFIFDDDGSSVNTVRPKISIKYPIGQFTPFISGEVYLPVFYNEYKPVDKVRVEAGLDYEFSKSHSAGIGYLIQRDYFQSNPRTDYIIELGYKYSF